MPHFKETAHFDGVKVVRETPAALLCTVDGKDVWIPKSQISDDSEVTEEGDKGTLIVSCWIANEKELV